MKKVIIKWVLIGILLLATQNILLLFIPSSPAKLVISFFGGMLIGLICTIYGLIDYIGNQE